MNHTLEESDLDGAFDLSKKFIDILSRDLQAEEIHVIAYYKQKNFIKLFIIKKHVFFLFSFEIKIRKHFITEILSIKKM
jgi:hypothetical protein